MSMEIIKLSATRRVDSGKGSSNRLRRAGQIPAIAYGKDLTPTAVAVSPKALLQVLGSEHGQNSVIELAVENDQKLTVMVRDYSYHPITRELTHADFVSVKLDQPVDVEVPFKLTGKAKGLVGGGILQQIFRRIPIRCLPEKIPAAVEIDVTELDIGESIKAAALAHLEGIKILLSDDQTIVVCAAPEKEEVVAAAPGAPGAPAAGAPGAPAAPAADGAAAPAAAAPAAKGGKEKEKK
jgi:large subunit ribosomal protein L25